MPAEDKVTQEQQYVLFELAGQEYGVNVHQVLSIERIPEITRVPRTPKFVMGVMNLRGEVLPVIDLRKRFALESFEGKEAQREQQRIIVVKLEEITVGMVVDMVRDVLSISAEQIEPPPSLVGGIQADYLDGMAKVGERVMVLLNLEKTLNQKELTELEDFRGSIG
ncbi:MAG: chemotaxis protein CheW [Bacillus thermozeamaize]|uniref:Chemotaxis protein CheW n=1 Tax=Bacillus thermozeamaize TaxID=230954 RepID=A0A1Y3PLX8_9BACI|nr:MAG: chemotaxis protein CheW [Bacillus thermozeamaize]